MKNNPAMARAGLANCNLQVSKAVFYPAHHTCKACKVLNGAQLAKRESELKEVGL